jgi:hypothetical protein
LALGFIISHVMLSRVKVCRCSICVPRKRKPKPPKRVLTELEKIFYVLHSARQRCESPRHISFPYYGGRGIRFHEGWRGMDGTRAFLEEVGPRPSPLHTLDRINSDGNYEPGNVRWATRKDQASNRRAPRPKRENKANGLAGHMQIV